MGQGIKASGKISFPVIEIKAGDQQAVIGCKFIAAAAHKQVVIPITIGIKKKGRYVFITGVFFKSRNSFFAELIPIISK